MYKSRGQAREFSSVGRASALQAGGHRFESYSSHHLNSWVLQPLYTALYLCGNGSVVERCLAKANVASSNLVSRSMQMPGAVKRLHLAF